jgi:N-6 DNA Methylase.
LCARNNGSFDLVASNIPFGTMQVFDAAFERSGDKMRRLSQQAIHNYFFIKGVDMLREGGILAFITSQGVLDSPGNAPIREWLIHRCNLVSALRLPNNLFTDYAGTQAGSDLIVLQKTAAGRPCALRGRRSSCRRPITATASCRTA